MSKETENIAVKKRLMFVKGDDFYFLSYNILLLLYHLGCTNADKQFKDIRKVAFLMDFVSEININNTLKEGKSLHMSLEDRDILMRSYSAGMLRLNEIVKLLFMLERQKLVAMDKDDKQNIINVHLNLTESLRTFLENELFKLETTNIKAIKANIKRMNVLNLETLLGKLFDNHGIERWALY